MKATMAVSLVVVLAATGCTHRPAQLASVPTSPGNAPVREIGEDIGGKQVMIDGKGGLIPVDVAEGKRSMGAVAKEKLDAMDALEKERLERFHDPDMKS